VIAPGLLVASSNASECHKQGAQMPRYMVQRTFAQGLEVPIADGGAEVCRAVIERHAEEGVTWVHSYVGADKRSTFCIYDASTPEAVRGTAVGKELPVDQITEVRVLDPYFYR
jgi:Protein of unknown function (DUF4242)